MATLSPEGLDFLVQEEGLRLRPYNDALGHCTVGVGHLLHLDNCTPEELEQKYTEQEVKNLLAQDVARFEAAVNEYVTVELAQTQFDALVSFAFNWGIGTRTGFPVTSVIRLVNEGRFTEAAEELVAGHGPDGRPYDKGLDGVRKRRIREAALLRGQPMKFVSRDEAGLRPGRGVAELHSDTVTAHYGGDGPGELDHSECAGVWRAWQAQHMDTDQLAPGGAADVAYNAGVCQHGSVFEGRGQGARSAANGTGEANRSSYAVVYIGGAAAPFTDEAKNGFNEAAEWLGGSLDYGHRDWVSTQCPGDEIYEWVQAGHPRAGEEEDSMTKEQTDALQWCVDVLKLAVEGLHPDNDDYGGAAEINRVVKEARTHLDSPHEEAVSVTVDEVIAEIENRL